MPYLPYKVYRHAHSVDDSCDVAKEALAISKVLNTLIPDRERPISFPKRVLGSPREVPSQLVERYRYSGHYVPAKRANWHEPGSGREEGWAGGYRTTLLVLDIPRTITYETLLEVDYDTTRPGTIWISSKEPTLEQIQAVLKQSNGDTPSN